MRIWIFLAGCLGAVGMALAAYHAHGLEKWLATQTAEPPELAQRLEWCGTAVRYQMLHVLALAIVAWLATRTRSLIPHVAGVLFVLGMAGFSGGLYEMTFRGAATHWAIVPAGGLLLILAWFAMAATALVRPNADAPA